MYGGRNEPFTISVKSNGSWSTFGNFTITEHNGLSYVMKEYTVNGSASNVTAIRISNDVMKVYGYNIAIAGVKAYYTSIATAQHTSNTSYTGTCSASSIYGAN